MFSIPPHLVESHMPRVFMSRGHFEREILQHRPDVSPYPHNHIAFSGFARGMFVVLANRFPPNTLEFKVGYYNQDFTFVILENFPVHAGALWYRREWSSLRKTALQKALWMRHYRPEVSSIWIPAEARKWDKLDVDEQEIVWRLMSSGAPGRVADVIDAAQACGLF